MGIEFNRVNPADMTGGASGSSAVPQSQEMEQTFSYQASEADRNMGLGVQPGGGRTVVVHPSGRYQITENGKTRYYAADGTELKKEYYESKCGRYLENGVWLKTETGKNFWGQTVTRQYYDIDETQYDPTRHMLFDGDISRRTIKTDKSVFERAWRSVKNTLAKADQAISQATGGYIQRGASGAAELVVGTAVATPVVAAGSAVAGTAAAGSLTCKGVATGLAVAGGLAATSCQSEHVDADGTAGGCNYHVTDNGDGSFTARFTSGPANGYTYTFRGDETDFLDFNNNAYGQANNMLKAMGFNLDDNNVTLGVSVDKASWNIDGQESVPNQGFSLSFPAQDLSNFGHNVPLQARCSILGESFDGQASIVTENGKQFVKIDSKPNPIYIRQENREIDGNLWENATVVYVGGTGNSNATYVIGDGGENDGGGKDVAIGRLNHSGNGEGTTFYFYGQQNKKAVPKDIYQVAYARANTSVHLGGGLF